MFVAFVFERIAHPFAILIFITIYEFCYLLFEALLCEWYKLGCTYTLYSTDILHVWIDNVLIMHRIIRTKKDKNEVNKINFKFNVFPLLWIRDILFIGLAILCYFGSLNPNFPLSIFSLTRNTKKSYVKPAIFYQQIISNKI